MPIKEYYKGRGHKVMRSMKERYGEEKGEDVFYATAQKKGMKPNKEKKKPSRKGFRFPSSR